MLKKIFSYFRSGKSIKDKVASRLDSWMNGYTGLGQAGRDKTTGTFFRACRVFCVAELDDLYRADGLTRRIIDIVGAEMLRQGFEIDGDPDGMILSKLEEMQALTKIAQLISWSRLYGAAVIVLGIADGRPLNEPVNLNSIEAVTWMQVYDRWQCQIMYEYLDTDLNSENYGLPLLYQVQDYRTGATFFVHYTRILRMDWTILPPRDMNWNQGWGESVITSIYDELKNYGSAFANVSVMMQDFVSGVLKVPGLSMEVNTSCGQSNIFKRIDMANLSKGTTSMMVLDGEEDFQKLSTNVSGVSELLDRFMLALSSVTAIPVTLLFGRSPAGLNSTGDSDIRNFYDMIKQYQETKLKPVLEKLFLYIFRSKTGPTQGVQPENWSIQFTPLWQNTEEQEANMRRTVAETDRIYIETGVLDPNEVAISRFGGDRWSMNTLIDVKARENGYDPNEIEILEAEKEKEIKDMPPEPTIGPNYLGNVAGGNDVIVVDR